ncbi:MAG: Trm112 family protein [Bacteroidota bacterium]
MLKKELLDILCCPKCKGDLHYEPEKSTLTCKKCSKVYQIKNDIPIMLVDDSLRDRRSTLRVDDAE